MANASQVTGLRFPEGEIPPTGDLVRHHSPRDKPWDYIHEEMEQDLDLAGMLYRLYEAVLSLKRRIVPADGTEGAREAAAMVRECIEGIPLWGQVLQHLVTHVGDGIAFAELNWTDHGGVLRPYEGWPRFKRHFAFKPNRWGEPELYVRRFGAKDGLIKPDPWKFLWPVRGLLYYPWGCGLKEKLYWYWKAKLFVLQDWQSHIEQWVRPITKIGFDTVDTGDRDADELVNAEIEANALEIARNVYGDGCVVFDREAMDVGVLTAEMSGNASFREFIETIARSMARFVLAEVNTLGLRPGTGAYASDVTAEGISHQKSCLVGHDLGAYLRDTLFKWLVEANLPGAPVPRMVIDMTSEAASRLLMDGVKEALEKGFPVAEQHLKSVWHLPDRPEPGDVSFISPRLRRDQHQPNVAPSHFGDMPLRKAA